MGRGTALVLGAFVASCALAQEGVIEATTAKGEKVKLLPNGRWEYVDPVKAEPQKKAQAAQEERESRAQGGLFGIGGKIYPGDKDYNRGSLGRK